jgi:hypothetical protein
MFSTDETSILVPAHGGWASLIISLADGKTDDRSLETVMNSNLCNVLIGLNKKAKEYHDYLTKLDSYDRH